MRGTNPHHCHTIHNNQSSFSICRHMSPCTIITFLSSPTKVFAMTLLCQGDTKAILFDMALSLLWSSIGMSKRRWSNSHWYKKVSSIFLTPLIGWSLLPTCHPCQHHTTNVTSVTWYINQTLVATCPIDVILHHCLVPPYWHVVETNHFISPIFILLSNKVLSGCRRD